jgi:hypothetical protein
MLGDPFLAHPTWKLISKLFNSINSVKEITRTKCRADDANLNESAIEIVISVIGYQWAAAVTL